ncbi:MAG: DNA replication and repair protein RecF [Dehalococcoidia bacterium]
MRLLRLLLFDYRNFHRLQVTLAPGASVFVGDNAQGKTNLLEAVYLLATTKELRAETEAQLIRRAALDDPIPAARVVGEAESAEGAVKVEIAIIAREGSAGLLASKKVKVNGVPKRLSDAVGRLTAVLFTAADIDLISGPPASRRRYLDITLSQVDRAYVSARARLERVITQRNHLLKRIREGAARADELAFWDDELARDGGYLFAVRSAALAELAALAAGAHAGLAPGEALRLEYRPRLDDGAAGLDGAESAAEAYREALTRGVRRDIAAGMTLQGPHRDDVAFFLDGEPAAGFASRAQQRTIALALRLAEARLLHARRGEPPVLLLDDILSEMDHGRARSVIESVSSYDQLLVTATDLDRFPASFLDGAALFTVEAGSVTAQSPAATAIPGTAES